MTDKQFNELKFFLTEAVDTAVKSRFNSIEKQLTSIHSELQTGFKQMDEDRKDFGEMKTSQATLVQRSKEMYDIVAVQTDRLSDKIDEKTEETIHRAVDEVGGKVEPAMKGILDKVKKGLPLKKKPWWRLR